jgi:hypothetical protein
VTQELGILALIKRGIRMFTANGDDLTDSSDPSRKMMRQIAGSFAEYEKARLVAKLMARANASGSHGQVRRSQEPWCGLGTTRKEPAICFLNGINESRGTVDLHVPGPRAFSDQVASYPAAAR